MSLIHDNTYGCVLHDHLGCLTMAHDARPDDNNIVTRT